MPSTTTSKPRSSGKRKRARSSEAQEERTGLHPQWSGSLSFGLVSIPVQLYSATRNARVSLRMLAPDGSPVVRRYFCPEHEQQLEQDELARGYEYKPGKYVQVSDEELEALEPDKSRDIDLRLFVPADSIDPVYFERMYFLTPSGDSNKAYHLLMSVMERTKRAGIATFVMHEREYLVAIFAQHGLLCAEVLRFHSELRDPSQLPIAGTAKPNAKLVKQFEALLSKHTNDKLDPESLHNQRNEAMRALATKKAKKGKDVVEVSENVDLTEEGETESVDLMKLLKQSLQ